MDLMSKKYIPLISLLLFSCLAACGEKKSGPNPADAAQPLEIVEDAPKYPSEPAAPDFEAIARNAVMANDRPKADLEDDPLRRPMKVISFMEAEPGMTILELEAGAGYYTEILSRAVGETGKVWMQNPAFFDNRLGDEIQARIANNRLANVTSTKSLFDNLEPVSSSIDIVTWMLGPHELYFEIPGTDGFGDDKKTYQEIFRVLKPGGTFLALDHAAPKGAPKTTGGITHRIDPAIVIALAEEAGLVLDAKSGALANPADDKTKLVFDPSVRRKTDRFILRFKKPAAATNEPAPQE